MPCEARPHREQFARRAFARAPSAHPPTVARAPRTRNRAIVGVKPANAHALTPCDTMQTERPWSSCPRSFGTAARRRRGGAYTYFLVFDADSIIHAPASPSLAAGPPA